MPYEKLKNRLWRLTEHGVSLFRMISTRTWDEWEFPRVWTHWLVTCMSNYINMFSLNFCCVVSTFHSKIRNRCNCVNHYSLSYFNNCPMLCFFIQELFNILTVFQISSIESSPVEGRSAAWYIFVVFFICIYWKLYYKLPQAVL